MVEFASQGAAAAQGINQGMNVFGSLMDMGFKQQAMEDAKAQKILGGIQFFKKDPGAGEVYFKSLLPSLGVDEAQGKMLIDMLKKSNDESIGQFTQMVGAAVAAKVPITTVLQTPAHEWPTLAKNIMDLGERQALNQVAQAHPMPGDAAPQAPQTQQAGPPTLANPGGTPAPAASPQTVGQPQPTVPQQAPQAGSFTPQEATNMVLKQGGQGEVAPQAAPAPAANMPKLPPGVPTSATPGQSSSLHVAGLNIPLEQGQGSEAMASAERHKIMLNRAKALENQGFADAGQKQREAANKEKSNAHITLTPDQYKRLGFLPGSVVQINAADGTLHEITKGRETLSMVTDPKILSKFKAGAVVMMNDQTKDMKVLQAGDDHFKPVDPAAFGLPTDSSVYVNQTTNKPEVVNAGGKMSQVLTTEDKQKLGLDPTMSYKRNTNGDVSPIDALTTERALTGDQAKADVTHMTELRKNVGPAKKLIDTAQTLKDMSVNSGMLAKPTIIAGQVLQALGMQDKANAMKTAKTEALQGMLNQSVADLASNLEGRVSGKTIQFLKQAQGSIYNTPQGLQILADALEQAGLEGKATHKLAEEHLKEVGPGKHLSAAGKEGQNFYEKFADMKGGTFTPEMQTRLDREEADTSLSGLNIKNLSANRISKMSMPDLVQLHERAKQGQLNQYQIDLAKERTLELKGGAK